MNELLQYNFCVMIHKSQSCDAKFKICDATSCSDFDGVEFGSTYHLLYQASVAAISIMMQPVYVRTRLYGTRALCRSQSYAMLRKVNLLEYRVN